MVHHIFRRVRRASSVMATFPRLTTRTAFPPEKPMAIVMVCPRVPYTKGRDA